MANINISTSLKAAIWKSTNQWSDTWESKYSQWFASEKVKINIFSDRKSPYFGLWGDCADTIYYLRAIFSHKHNLPFAIIHPLKKSPTLLSNENNSFDHLPKKERFKKFMKMLSNLAGTFHLGANDTYPISINKIKPGDIYIFQLRTRKKRKIIRHAMGIKKVNPNGTLDYIYSSPRIKLINEMSEKKEDQKSDLIYKKMQDPLFAPLNRLRGFRRFIWPRHLLKKREKGVVLKDSWLQQSKMANAWGEDKFLKYVKKTLTKKKEDIEITLNRKINDICSLTKQRVKAVKEALDYKSKINNRCFSYSEFDIYSSPMMDYVLKKNFNFLRIMWLKNKKEIKDEMIISTINSIFKNNGNYSYESHRVCPVNVDIRGKKSLDLGQIYHRLRKGLLSPNPNHSLNLRWGTKRTSKSKCKVFY